MSYIRPYLRINSFLRRGIGVDFFSGLEHSRAVMKQQMKRKTRSPYPVPGPCGGRLIREVIRSLREAGLELPITSHILIAISGGPDSLALGLLLARYGRRVASLKKMTFLHVNHGWRGKEAQREALFVRRCAKDWGAGFEGFRLVPPKKGGGYSWEEDAREKRKAVFASVAAKKRAIVLTAHQADDLAETVLWRLLTGAAMTHGGGIAVRSGVEVRPLLRVRKTELRDFLREEGVTWFDDPTNLEGEFLRARMRRELFPVLERLFPRAVERLVHSALEAQRGGEKVQVSGEIDEERRAVHTLIGALGLKLRHPHWKVLDSFGGSLQKGRGALQLDLPEGWLLRFEKGRSGIRWIFEKKLKAKR